MYIIRSINVIVCYFKKEMFNPWEKKNINPDIFLIHWMDSVPKKSTASHTYRHPTHIVHHCSMTYLTGWHSVPGQKVICWISPIVRKKLCYVCRDRQSLQREEAVCALSAMVGGQGDGGAGGWRVLLRSSAWRPPTFRGERETPRQHHSDPLESSLSDSAFISTCQMCWLWSTISSTLWTKAAIQHQFTHSFLTLTNEWCLVY